MDYLTLALILFTIGVIMLIAEILLPTGGILVVASLLFFALGVGIILARARRPKRWSRSPGWRSGLPAAGLSRVSAWRRMSLGTVLPEDAHRAGHGRPEHELEALKNRIGKTVSPMRPSGTVEFDGKRVDAMTEGDDARCRRVGPVRGCQGREGDRPADGAARRRDRHRRPTHRGARGQRTRRQDRRRCRPPLPTRRRRRNRPIDFDDLDLGLDIIKRAKPLLRKEPHS